MKPLPSLLSLERLLIVKTSSLGDVVHALPVAQALHEAHPTLELGWLVKERCADVLRGNPHIGRLHVMPNKPTLSDIARLRRELQAEHYQCALEMQGLALSGLLCWLSGAPIRIGWDRGREGNRLFLTHAVVPGSDITRHEVDALHGFAQVLGVRIEPGHFPPQAYLAQEHAVQAAQWLNELPCPRVALNVGTSRAYKRWPEANWAAVADGLNAQGCGLVFVGDARDAEAVARVQGQRRQAGAHVDLAGKTSLRELASVLAACDLLVSADSGPMHLAVAVGTPTIALFGGTDPRRHGPYGRGHVALHKPMSGEAPSRHPSAEYGSLCMRAIAPADVLDAVQAQLLITKQPAHA